MLPCVCSVKDHRWRQNVSGKNKGVAHEPQAGVSRMFLPHFDVLCVLLLNRPTTTWNLFVKVPSAIFRHCFFLFFFILLEYSFLEKFFNVISCSKQIIIYGENILQNSESVTIDCSSSTFRAQTDALFKGWNGHHSSSTYPSEPKKVRVVSYKELLRGLGSRDNNFFWWLIKKQFWFAL